MIESHNQILILILILELSIFIQNINYQTNKAKYNRSIKFNQLSIIFYLQIPKYFKNFYQTFILI